MAAGLLAQLLPELPIPNDVFGYIVNFLGVSDLFRLELTCKGYQTGVWYDFLTHIDSDWFLSARGGLLRRLEAHHKQVKSLVVSERILYTEVNSFLAGLLPQLTSFSTQFLEFLAQTPTGPVYELSKLNRNNLHSLTVGITKDSKVEAAGTMTVLSWLRAGLPNLRHLDIRIHITGQVKDTLEAILEGFSSLRSLDIMVGPSAIRRNSFGPGEMLSLLSSICLKNALSLQKVVFNNDTLADCVAEAIGFQDGNKSFDEWNERCKQLFVVPMSRLTLGMGLSRMWDYALSNTNGTTPYTDFDRLFQLCYESLSDQIHAAHDRILRPDRYSDCLGAADYFISKAQNWLPGIILAPSEEGVEIVAALAAESPIFFDAVKQILIGSAKADICFTMSAQVVKQLVRDAEFVATIGPSIARITDSYATLMSLMEDPETLLGLLKVADVGIFSCSRAHDETLRLIMESYDPPSLKAVGLKEVMMHILRLHQAHPGQNKCLQTFVFGWSQKTVQKLLQDKDMYAVLLAIFEKHEEIKRGLQGLKDGAFQPFLTSTSFLFGGASATAPAPVETVFGGGNGGGFGGTPVLFGAAATNNSNPAFPFQN
eukprot:TRINITY_DN7621_c0_g1_i1.p1 TRINITY_DN7621_c0_g1~~TRINITY_DN7621_c0_g1_i1.p1  ORF type:complete len:597 (+),score=67.54 TRINITY_DN7621_c0_g1_i1:89-1879(+)